MSELFDKINALATRIGQEVKKKLDKDSFASEEVKGIVQLATSEEVKAGTDAQKAVTPKTLNGVLGDATDFVKEFETALTE